MKKSIIPILLAIAWLVVSPLSSSAQAPSSPLTALAPGQGISQFMAAAHCDLGHFNEVKKLNHISSKRYRKLRVGLPIRLPASCSRPATYLERRNSWRDLHADHYRHSVRISQRSHSMFGRRRHKQYRHDHRLQWSQTSSNSDSPDAPTGTSKLKPPQRIAVPMAPGPVQRIYVRWHFYRYLAVILAILLIGFVTVASIMMYQGYRWTAPGHRIPYTLVERIHGKTYTAQLTGMSTGVSNDPESWTWRYCCPINHCKKTGLQYFEFKDHLLTEHEDVVGVEEEVDDQSQPPNWIVSRWRNLKWFRRRNVRP
jgi:hypothetical protein